MVGYSKARSHFSVLTIVVGSVVFGLDWQSAPMSPMPESKIVTTALPPAAPAISPPAAAPSIAAAPIVITPVAKTPSPPKCDVSACAAAYRTFRESDCTYMPNVGQRRLCTKGVRVEETAARNNPAITAIPPAPMPPAISAPP